MGKYYEHILFLVFFPVLLNHNEADEYDDINNGHLLCFYIVFLLCAGSCAKYV